MDGQRNPLYKDDDDDKRVDGRWIDHASICGRPLEFKDSRTFIVRIRMTVWTARSAAALMRFVALSGNQSHKETASG
jgi:hypothetical protein